MIAPRSPVVTRSVATRGGLDLRRWRSLRCRRRRRRRRDGARHRRYEPVPGFSGMEVGESDAAAASTPADRVCAPRSQTRSRRRAVGPHVRLALRLACERSRWRYPASAATTRARLRADLAQAGISVYRPVDVTPPDVLGLLPRPGSTWCRWAAGRWPRDVRRRAASARRRARLTSERNDRPLERLPTRRHAPRHAPAVDTRGDRRPVPGYPTTSSRTPPVQRDKARAIGIPVRLDRSTSSVPSRGTASPDEYYLPSSTSLPTSRRRCTSRDRRAPRR
jgi:hypothetical protein